MASSMDADVTMVQVKEEPSSSSSSGVLTKKGKRFEIKKWNAVSLWDLRLNMDSNQGAIEFWAEIEMLSKFRHSYIVSLLGYCEESGNREMILVYEYMSNGSPYDHFHKNRANRSNSSPLSWVQMLNICVGATRGLDYLHRGTSVQFRVIHRDVKSSNIFLNENLEAKISTLGYP
nr:serine/threonine/dual specificity protein kinase, catalytic domain-containing protein [Tanacetum cinerariifolium]